MNPFWQRAIVSGFCLAFAGTFWASGILDWTCTERCDQYGVTPLWLLQSVILQRALDVIIGSIFTLVGVGLFFEIEAMNDGN